MNDLGSIVRQLPECASNIFNDMPLHARPVTRLGVELGIYEREEEGKGTQAT